MAKSNDNRAKPPNTKATTAKGSGGKPTPPTKSTGAPKASPPTKQTAGGQTSPAFTNPTQGPTGYQQATIFGQTFLVKNGKYYAPGDLNTVVAHLNNSNQINWENQNYANYYSQSGKSGNARNLPSWETNVTVPSAYKETQWKAMWGQAGPSDGSGGGGASGGGGSGGGGGIDDGGGLDGSDGGGSDGGTTGPGPTNGGPFSAEQNSLLATIKSLLSQYGLNTPDLIAFATKAIAQNWGQDEIINNLRDQPDYLANPLFKANKDNARDGKGFMSEGEVLAYSKEAKRLAKQFGFKEPSDNYIANGLRGGLSIAEYEHRLAVQDRVNQFGGGVSLVYRELMGKDPTDQDLYEIFDKEISTKEFDDNARMAEMRGRPVMLGLGIRSQAEASALNMMGLDLGEVWSRYQAVQQNAPRFARLQSIENMITDGLPDNFGQDLSTQENSTLVRALLFQDPQALARLQDVTAREVARFKTSASPQATQGQLSGLLSDKELATYG